MSFFSKWLSRLKTLAPYERSILALIGLCGFILFLLGYIVQNEFGHAIMAFATVITLECIVSTFNRFLTDKKNAEYLRTVYTEVRRDLLKDILQAQTNERLVLARTLTEVLAGTRRIVNYGIVNIFQGLDLKRALGQCKPATTVLLRRTEFSRKEFGVLQQELKTLITEKNCRVLILLSSARQMQALRLLPQQFLPDKRQNLQLRIHKDRSVGPITAYNDRLIAGVNGNDDQIEEGFQIMVKGPDTEAYRQWHQQFDQQWQRAITPE